MSDISQDSQESIEDEMTEIFSGYKVLAMGGTPSYTHQIIVGKLFSQMDPYFESRKCKPILGPISVDFTETVKNLDSEFIRKSLIMKAKKYYSNLRNKSDEDITNIVIPDIFVMCEPSKMKDSSGTYYGVPSLIIEVLSPGTENTDMDYKRILYESCKVKEYIIIVNHYTAIHYVLKEDSIYHSITYNSRISQTSHEEILTIPSSQFPELNLILTSSWF